MNVRERFNLSRFIKGEKKPVRRIILNQRRIFILPTNRGLGFVVLIILLLLMAFVYNNNLAYLLTFLLASIFFITILHSYKSLAALVLSQGHSRAVFAGEAAEFDIVIDNPDNAERFSLRISLDNTLNFSLATQEKNALLSIPQPIKEVGMKLKL